MAWRLLESNLIVEVVMSMDMYCKYISNVERYRTETRGNHIFALSNWDRPCEGFQANIRCSIPFLLE